MIDVNRMIMYRQPASPSVIIPNGAMADPGFKTFAGQRALIEASAKYQYSIDGQWEPDTAKGRPDARRVLIPRVDDFRASRDTYNAWQAMVPDFQFKPVRPEEAFARLYQKRASGTPVNLFIPWGVRPEGNIGPEVQVMERIANFQALLAGRRIQSRAIIMPADVYATEINSVDIDLTEAYFGAVGRLARRNGFDIMPWSRIKDRNRQEYYRLATLFNEDVMMRDFVPPEVFDRAMKSAARRSGYDDPTRIRKAALAYLRERLIEARIVEMVYRPIKFSLVDKVKDNIVDGDLPRLYMIPPSEQFPWLK